MITLAGLRNGLWCALAFAIVACASAPLPTGKIAVAQGALQRAEQANAARFAQIELDAARQKLAAAQAAADKRDAEIATRMAEQADVDAQLAELTARAKQQEQLAADVDATLRDLRSQALERDPTAVPQPH
jgi:septal ring factor EnvC (AmiA/AmiB activator)